MRAWQITSFDDMGLACVEATSPPLRQGHVRLRPTAWALNYRDVLVARGLYNPRQELPLVPLSDAVGHIVEMAPDVEGWSVGDRACPTFHQTWMKGPPGTSLKTGALGSPLPGTLAEELVVPAHALVRPPADWTDAEAATLPCAGVTAWRCLQEGRIGPGAKVLTLGTGGVSLYTVQLARLLGAEVWVTSSSPDKLDRVAAMGAHRGPDYTADPKWGRTVGRETGGVNLVVETGGASLNQSLEAVAIGGTISLIGVLEGPLADVLLTRIVMKAVRVQGVVVGHKADFEALVEALQSAPDVRPVLAERVPFSAAPAAFALQQAGPFGKVVIEAD